MQLLLQHKANPEQMDCWGRRPVDLLLVTRRMAEARRDCPYVDATGIERACEEIATMFGAGAVDLLLRYRANVESSNGLGRFGVSPLTLTSIYPGNAS